MESVNFTELKLWKNLCRIACSSLFLFSLIFFSGYNLGLAILWGAFIAILLVFLVSLIHIVGLKFGFWSDSNWMDPPLGYVIGPFTVAGLLITDMFWPVVFPILTLVLLYLLYKRKSYQFDLASNRLYLEFTALFFLFPLVIVNIVLLIHFGGFVKNSESISKIVNLLLPVALSLLIIWIFASFIILGSKSIVEWCSFEKCRDSIFQYLYKQILQVRCIFLFSPLVIFLQGVFPEFRYMSAVFGVLGVGMLASSVSEIFLIKKVNSIRFRDGVENLKILKGLIKPDILVVNFKNPICVSPQLGESKRCVAEKIGYLKCENCKKLTSD